MKFTGFFPKIILFATFICGSFFALYSQVSATDLPFTDVSKTDSYYTELKGLYDNGLVQDTKDHLFHPNSQIERDEFVSIIIGVGCKQCLYPSLSDILKYSSFPFVDVAPQNRYFYCISYAKENSVVQGYILDSTGKLTCQDGSVQTETPFCPKNKIERIEAVAALLRQANLWDESLNSSNFEHKLTISDIDNYWYGYAQKGIQAGILKIDADNKVFPHEYITRKEFVEMSGKIFEMNQCQMSQINTTLNTDSTINIFDSDNKNSCSGNGYESTFSNKNTTIYDFYAKSEVIGDIEYHWEFSYIGEDGKLVVIKSDGQCLDDYDLLRTGKWHIKLTLIDKKTGQVLSESNRDIFIGNTDDISADVLIFDKTDPLSSQGKGTPTTFPDPYEKTYDFYAKTESTGNLTYTWVFTNPATGEIITKTGKSLDDFTFPSDGKWEVKLTIKDVDSGKSSIAVSTVDIKNVNRTNPSGTGTNGLTLSADIGAMPLVSELGTVIDFTSTINSSNQGPFEYHWDFGDGTFSADSNPNHVYTTPGVYVVTLHVRDKDGNMSISQVTIVVTKIADSDKDGLNDTDDKCPYVYGPASNQGCPIITTFDDGKIGFDDLLGNKCMKEGAESLGGFYIGQATCSQCPCENTLDYIASARICDIFFPAITSLDKKEIFSRGSIKQFLP